MVTEKYYRSCLRIKAQAQLGIAVKKGDKDLLDLINTVLKELKQSGETDILYKMWLIGVK